jgi:hypothetical protein
MLCIQELFYERGIGEKRVLSICIIYIYMCVCGGGGGEKSFTSTIEESPISLCMLQSIYVACGFSPFNLAGGPKF